MTFGDIGGLERAAATLDELGQRADQQRRAVAAVTASLTSRENWGGAAARAFEASTHGIHGHMRGSAGAATRTAAVLRRLAADLTVAEELDQRARQAALAADATLGRPPVPTATPSFVALDQPDLRARADAGFAAARDAAEAAWRAAAAALQSIWAWDLAADQAVDVGSKAAGAGFAFQAAAKARMDGAAAWQRRADARQAEVRASDATGEALGELRAARDAARENWRANARLYDRAPAWAKKGFYAGAGRLANATVADLGEATGAARGLGEAGGAMRVVGEVPLLGIAAGAANTVADIDSGVNPTRAVVANAASLLAATALVAVATGPGAPFVVTAAAVAVLGYGVGNAVHGLIAYGDLSHDLKSDAQAVGKAAGWVGRKAGDAAHAFGHLIRTSPLW